jgi:hypothetical protein
MRSKSIPATLAVLVVSVVALQACGGGAEPTAGPCEHTYLEPILLIDAVTVEGETTPLSRVVITDLRLDGVAVASPLLESSTGIVATADGLECSVPCGLQNTEGTYTFQLKAPGYVTRSASVQARYAVFDGGCPSSNNGGTHVSFTMRRE